MERISLNKNYLHFRIIKTSDRCVDRDQTIHTLCIFPFGTEIRIHDIDRPFYSTFTTISIQCNMLIWCKVFLFFHRSR